jgi:hypothetical protein
VTAPGTVTAWRVVVARPGAGAPVATIDIHPADLADADRLLRVVRQELRRAMQIRGCASFTVDVHHFPLCEHEV